MRRSAAIAVVVACSAAAGAGVLWLATASSKPAANVSRFGSDQAGSSTERPEVSRNGSDLGSVVALQETSPKAVAQHTLAAEKSAPTNGEGRARAPAAIVGNRVAEPVALSDSDIVEKLREREAGYEV